ncbi:MAG: hypothetical protein K8S99_01995 [Planctomycetes bacterium]|nr:hypothetical protein [Planctomycetota bacterium]
MRLYSRDRVAALLLAFGACLTLASGALAKVAVVTLNDGSQRTGEVVSDEAAGVILLISNIRVTIPRADIRSIDYPQTIETQYAERRAKIADDNLQERLVLGRWLFENKSYVLAKKEVDDLKVRFPNDTNVDNLARAIDARLKLAEETAKAVKPAEPVKPPTMGGNGKTQAAPGVVQKYDENGLPTERMPDKDVNTIRVYEVDFSARPRISVPRDVIDEFLTKYSDREEVPKGEARRKFKSAPAEEQLRKIFELKAREFYGLVTVKDDPAFIQSFRSTIHRTYVLNYCGTANCHGGANGGGLYLFHDRATSDNTIYTNFLTLARYEDSRGNMIDLQKPDKSYLLQYGRPRTEVGLPHPEAKGWRPFSANPSDPVLIMVEKWIADMAKADNSSKRFAYPVTFPPARVMPPTPKASPAPVITPAPAPTSPPPVTPAGETPPPSAPQG